GHLVCPSAGVWIQIFFFSSRRRHTRCYRDWSSDVCSSDLAGFPSAELDHLQFLCTVDGTRAERELSFRPAYTLRETIRSVLGEEIGRASCRERGWIWG